MLYCIIALATTKLEPGVIMKNVCTDLNTGFEIDIQHDSEQYNLTISVEALDGTIVDAIAFGLSIAGNNVSQVLEMNGRKQLTNYKKGKILLTLKCTKIGSGDKTVYIHYTDSWLLRNNEKFNTQLHSIDDLVDTYFMVPVCHDAVEFTINTTALVYASFEEARPGDGKSQWSNKGANATFTIPADKIKIPGFLYLRFISQLTGVHTYISPYQLHMAVLTPEKQSSFSLSSMKYCDDHFKIQLNVSSSAHLVVAAVDTGVKLKYSAPAMFMRAPFDEYWLTGRAILDRDVYSERGVLDVQPSLYKDYYDKDQVAGLGISMNINASYLPVTHAAKNSTNYHNYSIFVSFSGHYLFPGDSSTINDNERWQQYQSKTGQYLIKDTVMLYKDTSQLDYVDRSLSNKPKYSDYIIEFKSNKTSHIMLMSFGQGQPDVASGKIFKQDDRLVGILRFDDINIVNQCELTYARMYRDVKDVNETISGKVRAEHSFLLKQHIEYQFNILSTAKEGYVYGHFDPIDGNGMQLTITKMAYSSPSIIIYVSQKEILPDQFTFEHTFVCDSATIETCSFSLSPDQINISEKIYIGFMAKGDFQVILSEAGDVLTALFEYQQYNGSLIIFNGSKKDTTLINRFIFNPIYRDHNMRQLQNEFAIVRLEMYDEAVGSIMQHNIDVTVSINTIPQPLSQYNSTTFNMLQWTSFGSNGKIGAKKHSMIKIETGQKIFVDVACKGFNCGNISRKTTIAFKITVNTITQIPETTSWGDFAVKLRSDGHAQSLFFSQDEDELTALNVFAPQQIGEEHQDIKCQDIKINLYVCIGTHPDKTDFNNISHLTSCFNANITSELYKQIELDSSKDNIASGTVFVLIVPDYSNFKGNTNMASVCSTQIQLYKNKQITQFNQRYQATVFLGASVKNGAHFAANIPVITQNAATDLSYGDRMVLQFASEKKVLICVTDMLEVYYPEPSQNSVGQCTIYYSTISVLSNTLEIHFKNYMNQKSSGNIPPTTRIYFTMWVQDEIILGQDSKGFNINISLYPQAFLQIGQTTSFYFYAKSLAGNNRYVSIAFDVRGYDNPIISDMQIIAGPDCNNQKCRKDPPEEFFQKSITTLIYINQNEQVLQSSVKGINVILLQEALRNYQSKINTIYVMIEYHHSNQINKLKTKSSVPYSVYITIRQNQIDLQSVSHSSRGAVINQYYSPHYNTTSIVIFPCRGKPALMLDMSPAATPEPGNHLEIVKAPWGAPITKIFTNDSDVNWFISVYDDIQYQTNKFASNTSQMQYRMFFGSPHTQQQPGNGGQLVVTEFSSSHSGKVRIRFWPASSSQQNVKYKLFAVLFATQFDQELSFSPITSCGITGGGHSIYKNVQNGDDIAVDQKVLEKNGFIEVESNQKLWVGDQKPVLITVILGEITYQHVIVGETEITIFELIAIMCSTGAAVVAAAGVVVWGIFVKRRLMM